MEVVEKASVVKKEKASVVKKEKALDSNIKLSTAPGQSVYFYEDASSIDMYNNDGGQ
jgi:hypothetical protein